MLSIICCLFLKIQHSNRNSHQIAKLNLSLLSKCSLSYSFPHAEKNCLLFGKKLRKILEALKWHEFVYIFSSIKKCMILKTLDFDALHSSLNRNMCLSNNEKNYAFINYGTLQDQRSISTSTCSNWNDFSELLGNVNWKILGHKDTKFYSWKL